MHVVCISSRLPDEIVISVGYHFQTRNLTHTGARELYTGLTDLSKKGFMVSWHKKKVLDYWATEECNSLEDVRAPGGFPIDMDKTDALRVFIGGLCRTIEFKYKKEVSVSYMLNSSLRSLRP